MRINKRTSRKAVAPVLATLMMIAVAVAMSVIIFVWSQGFLSQTSSAAGGQQSQQNIAAQSSVSIELAVFNTGTGANACGGTSPTVTGPCVTIVARNVGSVAETIGSLVIVGSSGNSGFKSSVTDVTLPTTGTATAQCAPSSGSTCSAGKGQSLTLGEQLSGLKSGDIVSIKVSTTAGTFATQQFTVP